VAILHKMTKKTVITFTTIVVLTFVVLFTLHISDDEVYGEYVNTNFENPICCLEAPHEADTLLLHPDMTFKSKYYGIGSYKITHNFLITYIYLRYHDGHSPAGLQTHFDLNLIGPARILLNPDLNHYYKKIK